MLSKKYPFGLVILLCFRITEAHPKNLSSCNFDDIRISLLTYSPGEKLYSIFGHSAIRIYRPASNEDLVYNYGTFNFDESGFYLKFLKGKLVYSLSRTSFDRVKQSLILENRSLIETPLVLDKHEEIRIVAFLEKNLLPENKDYRYDFFYDNCATRIIDLLNSCIGDTLVLSSQVLPELTFRQLLNPYLKKKTWIHLGIDLLMGTEADKVARFTEPAFLPDYLHLIIKNYQYRNENEPTRLSQHDIIHIQNYPAIRTNKLTPSIILWPLFLLITLSILINSYVRPLFLVIGNITLFTTGILSLFLCFLWLFPEHTIFRYNSDLLWANPLLLLIPFLQRPKFPTTCNKLKSIILVLTCSLILSGVITSFCVEKNMDLTVLALTVLVISGNKLMNSFSGKYSANNQ